MPKMKIIVCACGCQRKKEVRVSDIKRGWGKFYSKSCKAKYQEKRTGQHKRFLTGNVQKKYHYKNNGNNDFNMSTARTNNLWCSDCNKRIQKGEQVVFELCDDQMVAVACSNCMVDYVIDVATSDIHPFSSEGIGQD